MRRTLLNYLECGLIRCRIPVPILRYVRDLVLSSEQQVESDSMLKCKSFHKVLRERTLRSHDLHSSEFESQDTEIFRCIPC